MIKDLDKVRTRSSGRAIIIEFSGDIDSDVPSARELAERAIAGRSKLAILDFTRAHSINSKGLEWLEQVATTLEPCGIRVRVVTDERSKVGRILHLMKFDRFVLVLATLFDAVTFGRRRRNIRKISPPNPPLIYKPK